MFQSFLNMNQRVRAQPQNKLALAARVRQLRVDVLGQTQMQFCAMLGCIQACVSRWERGHFCPSARYLERMQELFVKYGERETDDKANDAKSG